MLRRFFKSLTALFVLVLLTLAVSVPATAHKEHKKKLAPTEQVVPGKGSTAATSRSAMHAQMDEALEHGEEDRSTMSTTERLLDWLGRTHPVIVHFPIAFFPAALFTAILARRRPAFAAPVRFLVIAGGLLAPVAGLLGWFDGGFDPATDGGLLQIHRWLGTGIGISALALAAWAWRRPEASRGAGMIAGLGLITIAIAIQGWFGGAMVHGVDHLNW